MTKRVSIKQQVRRTKSEDAKARKAWTKSGSGKTADSFQNFQALMGIGTDNVTSGGTYGFNPITRIRTLLEWIHRGSWLGGVAVDVVADDMTRAGVTIKGKLDPDDREAIEESINTMNIWGQVSDVVKWSRLYGGALGVYMIKGQDMSTPLRIETVGKDQFKGLLVLDRWMVEPSMGDIIQELGPNIGLPKYYYVTTTAPYLREARIHYSRVIRLDGIRMTYWQRQMENLWGISVLERLYDRMLAYDSATTGVAQLIYKSYLRTYRIKDLREIISAGGESLNGLVKYIDMMRRFQSIEGVTLLDADDEFEGLVHNAFGGLAEALLQIAQQVAGSLGIPLVRLLGQSPGGLGSSGESEIRQYFDSILQQQNKDLRVAMVLIYRMTAQSLGIKLPKGFGLEFNPLWQLTDTEKVEIASKAATMVKEMEEAGITDRQTNLKELRQSGEITGYWTNITDEAIANADDEPPPTPVEVAAAEAKAGEPVSPDNKAGAKKASSTKDSYARDGWVTVNGAHVFYGANGEVLAGPSKLEKEAPKPKHASLHEKLREEGSKLQSASEQKQVERFAGKQRGFFNAGAEHQYNNDPDVDTINARGKSSTREHSSESFQPRTEGQCHWNAASALKEGKIDKIHTGYALSKGNGWLQHSWGSKNGKTVELNPENEKITAYHGVELDPEETEAFVKHTEQNRPGLGMVRTNEGGRMLKPISATKVKDVAPMPRRRATKDTIYAQGEVFRHHQLPVVIESAQGTVRRGVGWQTTMPADYGYIRRHEGADGDQLDCYVGPSPESDLVVVVDQIDLGSHKFDEHKVMLGYHTLESALEDYDLGYHDGRGPERRTGVGAGVSSIKMSEFKEWLVSGDLTKPFSG